MIVYKRVPSFRYSAGVRPSCGSPAPIRPASVESEFVLLISAPANKCYERQMLVAFQSLGSRLELTRALDAGQFQFLQIPNLSHLLPHLLEHPAHLPEVLPWLHCCIGLRWVGRFRLKFLLRARRTWFPVRHASAKSQAPRGRSPEPHVFGWLGRNRG